MGLPKQLTELARTESFRSSRKSWKQTMSLSPEAERYLVDDPTIGGLEFAKDSSKVALIAKSHQGLSCILGTIATGLTFESLVISN